jgi:undecaprenyl diphosphate synthase
LKIQSTAVEKNIRVRFLSSHPEPLPAHIQALTRTIEEATQHGASLCLNVCLSYGSRGEIVNACKSIADKVRAGELGVDQIDERLFARHLLTHDQPDPDLVLRTSGECRVSNYLLYQLAYSELAFVDKPWPAITRDDLNNVLQQYEQRHRRFGK